MDCGEHGTRLLGASHDPRNTFDRAPGAHFFWDLSPGPLIERTLLGFERCTACWSGDDFGKAIVGQAGYGVFHHVRGAPVLEALNAGSHGIANFLGGAGFAEALSDALRGITHASI
jgi:hypothetical protein